MVIVISQAVKNPNRKRKLDQSHELFENVASFDLLDNKIISRLPLCRANEHVNGSWIFDDSIAHKNYYCCGYDDADHRHNIEKCGGITLKGLVEHYGSNEWKPQTGGHSCTCDKREGRTSVNKREKYKWVPHACRLVPWNATLFCELLDNRRIFFYGDSTMQQSAHGLMSLIIDANAGCANLTYFHKTEYLFPNSGLMKQILQIRPDILIFAFGPHGKDRGDTEYTLQQFVEFVINSRMFQLYKWDKKEDYKKEDKNNIHNRNVTVLWRTNTAGHIECDKINEPVKEYKFLGSDVDWFRWTDFPEWDEISRNYTRGTDVQLLDMSPLYFRGDAHPGNGDCLHFCMPGPTDLFSYLLLQKLVTGEI
eukprot:gene17451-24138_t